MIITDTNTRHTIWSTEGVRQGDPLGPLLFSVTIRQLIAQLQRYIPDSYTVAYLDDVYVFSNSPDTLREIANQMTFSELRLRLNMTKSRIYYLHEVRQTGLKALGSFVGPEGPKLLFLHMQLSKIRNDLEALSDLPNQHALILLRQSIQLKLRHLARTMDTTSFEEFWHEVDQALYTELRRIRGDGPNINYIPVDEQIISLPVRVGGLGITSYQDTFALAHRAMTDSARAVLKARLNGVDEQEALADVTKQAAHIRIVHQEKHKALVDNLSDHNLQMHVDNSSYMGSRWLSTLPFSAEFKLKNKVVSAGLLLRCLRPGANAQCRHCFAPNVNGHDDICSARPTWRVARHEMIKKTLAWAISTESRSSVRLEPGVTSRDSRMRTDLEISGPAATHGSKTCYDLTIRAPTSTMMLNRPASSVLEQYETRIDKARTEMKMALDAMHVEKERIYAERVAPTHFEAIVFSLGGTIGGRTQVLIDHWRRTVPIFSNAMERISLTLLRARCEHFDIGPDEISP